MGKITLAEPTPVGANCPKCGAAPGEDHIVVGEMPLARIIRAVWKRNNFARATDGCRIGYNEHYCEHGHGSWRDVLKANHIKGRPLRPEEIIDADDALDWGDDEPEELTESEQEEEFLALMEV